MGLEMDDLPETAEGGEVPSPYQVPAPTSCSGPVEVGQKAAAGWIWRWRERGRAWFQAAGHGHQCQVEQSLGLATSSRSLFPSLEECVAALLLSERGVTLAGGVSVRMYR